MIEAFWISFLAGLFAPLGAVCVLPVYPGFLAYLAAQVQGTKDQTKKVITFGWVVTAGVITSMLIVGFIVSFLLQGSLTNAIGIISPIAFGILTIVSIFLILNKDLSSIIPKFDSPNAKNPYWNAFLFGIFFGVIVLPCNPASLVLLFAIVTSITTFIINFIHFILFGIGMSLPLLLFAYLSTTRSGTILQWIGKNKRKINVITGIIMLTISLYYLFYVFKIQELVL